MKQLKKLAALGLRLPLPSGPTPIKAPLDVASKFIKAWNEGDAKAIGDLFVEDADFVSVVGLWWTSRRSIRRALKRGFQEWFAGSTFSVEKLSQRLLGPERFGGHRAGRGHQPDDRRCGDADQLPGAHVLTRRRRPRQAVS